MPNPHQQKKTVRPPTPSDTALREFSGTVQENVFDLWNLSHDHIIATATKAQYAALTTDTDRIAFIATFLGLQ